MLGGEIPEAAAAAATKGRCGNPGPRLPGVIGVLADLEILDSGPHHCLYCHFPGAPGSGCHL